MGARDATWETWTSIWSGFQEPKATLLRQLGSEMAGVPLGSPFPNRPWGPVVGAEPSAGLLLLPQHLAQAHPTHIHPQAS